MSSKVDKQKIINNLEKTPNWNDAGNSYCMGGWVGGNPVFLTHQALFYHMDIKPRYSSVFVL